MPPNTPPPMFSLLESLPADVGECRSSDMGGEAFAGWRQVVLVLGDGLAGLRVVTGMYDPAGRVGMISDLVATDGGRRQESVGARVESDGQMQGTHWLTEEDRHVPRPITADEVVGLRALADALWRRATVGR